MRTVLEDLDLSISVSVPTSRRPICEVLRLLFLSSLETTELGRRGYLSGRVS